jgi:hypothetical protein
VRGVVLTSGDMSETSGISRFLKVSSCTWDDFNAFVPWNGNDSARWSGKVQHLGGKIAGPPVPVALGGDPLEVFGLGADYALYQMPYNAPTDAMGNHWSPAREIDPLSRSSRIGVFVTEQANSRSTHPPWHASLDNACWHERAASSGSVFGSLIKNPY